MLQISGVQEGSLGGISPSEPIGVLRGGGQVAKVPRPSAREHAREGC